MAKRHCELDWIYPLVEAADDGQIGCQKAAGQVRGGRVKIYVASSWRCEYQQAVVYRLRTLGHEVYDFRGAGTGWGEDDGPDGGFHWTEVDPDYKTWPQDIPRYIAGLNNPRAIEGFNRDMSALIRCDACILVNPCGQSAHAELGWACGAGKLTAAFCPAIREPDLMLKMASLITDKWEDILEWLDAMEEEDLRYIQSVRAGRP